MTLRTKKILLQYSILLFAVFPLIPNSLKGIPVIILLIVSLFFFKNHKVNIKKFVINSSLYFIYLFSLIYTSNLSEAFNKLETTLSILVLPLIFYIILSKKVFDEDLKQEFMKLFMFSTSLFSVIIIIAILLDTTTVYYKDFYTNKYRMIVEVVPLIGQHPIYASLFLAISILFLMNIYFSRKKKLTHLWKAIYLVCALLNVLLLIMLSSKSVILSLIILAIIFVIKEMKSKKNLYILSLLLLLLLSLFIFNRRMSELIMPETYSDVNSNYSNSFRIQIYKCTFQIIKDSWLTGVGVGDSQDILDSCYIKQNKLLLEKRYNSHNQYLDTWIKTGVIGLMVFLFFLFYNLRGANQTNNYILFGILFLYGFNFLTENILARQSGVILFYFLINFMAIEKDNRN